MGDETKADGQTQNELEERFEELREKTRPKQPQEPEDPQEAEGPQEPEVAELLDEELDRQIDAWSEELAGDAQLREALESREGASQADGVSFPAENSRIRYDSSRVTKMPDIPARDLSEIGDINSSMVLEGVLIADRYILAEKIGEGGMGVVYRAWDRKLDRQVVVKLSRALSSEHERKSLEREVLGLSMLDHPNVVQIEDFGHIQDRSFLVMEYLEGKTLEERLKQGPLSMDEFRPIARQLLAAMAAAHEHGLVHRDIKAENVMLCPAAGEPLVKLVDFGLARSADQSDEITQQALVGTFAFVAPEVILDHDYDERSDVYSLGVLFYYMLSGERPFAGRESVSILYQHVHEEPRPLIEALSDGHDVPQELLEIVHACLAKQPSARPANAGDLLDWMEPCLDPDADRLPQSASATSPSPASWVSGARRALTQGRSFVAAHADKKVLAALAAIVLVSLGSAAFLLPGEEPEPERDRRAEVAALLDRADTLVTMDKFGQADMLIERIQTDIDKHPELLVRAISIEDRIELGRMLERARELEDEEDLDGAKEIYRAILARDASHEVARERLSALATTSGEEEEVEEEDEAPAKSEKPKTRKAPKKKKSEPESRTTERPRKSAPRVHAQRDLRSTPEEKVEDEPEQTDPNKPELIDRDVIFGEFIEPDARSSARTQFEQLLMSRRGH